MSRPSPEHPVPFRDSLPLAVRELCWLPYMALTLAFLPCGQGHTVYQVRYAPQTRQFAWNVAQYRPSAEEGP
jgi:hypothetical protein